MSMKFLPWTSANEFLSIEMVNSIEMVFRCYSERGRRFFRILAIDRLAQAYEILITAW